MEEAGATEDELEQVTKDIAALEREVDDLLASGGDRDRLRDCESRLDDLTRKRRQLRQRLDTGQGRDGGHQHRPDLPVAELVTAALDALGATADSRSLMEFIEAVYATHVSPSRMAVLRRDDERALRRSIRSPASRGTRPVWLAPALHFDRLVPVRGRYALSAWDAWSRVVGPRSVRRDHLEHVIRLSDVLDRLRSATDDDAAATERVERLLRRRAITVPGAVEGRTVEPKRVREASIAELDVIRDLDDAARADAAQRLDQFADPLVAFFGVDEPRAVAQGASG